MYVKCRTPDFQNICLMNFFSAYFRRIDVFLVHIFCFAGYKKKNLYSTTIKNGKKPKQKNFNFKCSIFYDLYFKYHKKMLLKK